jgi:hypothetical protein
LHLYTIYLATFLTHVIAFWKKEKKPTKPGLSLLRRRPHPRPPCVSSGEVMRCRWRAGAAELSAEAAMVLSAVAEESASVPSRRSGKRPAGRRTSPW